VGGVFFAPVSDLSPAAQTQLAHFVRPPGLPAALAVRALVRALVALGHGGRAGAASFVGRMAHGLGIRRAVTEDNLRQAYPEWSGAEVRRVARDAYVNMARAVLDAITSPELSDAEASTMLLDGPGADAFFEAARSGKGAILATAHFGSWELLGDLLLRRGVPLSAVVRPLSGALNGRIVEARLRSGMQLIHPRGAIASVCRALEQGRVVAVLPDQVVPADKGVFVPFFGRQASTAPALAVAAVRTGAPVFVGCAHRVDHRISFSSLPPLYAPDTGDERADVATLMARVTLGIEQHIRSRPEQWLWLHRRWKVAPPATAQVLSIPTP